MPGLSADAEALRNRVASREGPGARFRRALAAAVRPLAGNPVSWLIAACLVLVALDGGGYSLPARNSLAIAAWWTIGLTVVTGLLPRTKIPRAALVTGGALASFAVWTALSAAWAPSAEAVTEEANRVVLYLGVFVLVVIAARRGSARNWADGLGLGIAGVGVLALASRLFPGLGLQGDVSAFFPGGVTYLSWPVNYWNGLATLMGLGLPLLLRSGMGDRAAIRGLALAAFPAMVGVIYLTSSRGGTVAALVAVVVFIGLTDRRVTAVATLAVGLAGGAAAGLVLNARSELVNGPFNTATVASQGRSAAVLIVAICVLTGVAGARVGRLQLRFPALGRRVRLGLLAAVVLVVGAAIVAAHPARQFNNFKSPPTEALSQQTTTVGSANSHLFDSGGNGRWQFWSASVHEFDHHPVLGGGAGSYESWWAQHGSVSYFTRHAHSLFLETLGTLGILGLLLLVAMFAVAARSGLRRLRDRRQRATVAALLAVLAGFVFAAAIDWMWELTVVGLVAVAVLGLLTGSATLSAEGAGGGRVDAIRGRSLALTRRARMLALGGIAALSLLLVVAQAAPLLADHDLRNSETALQHGRLAAALSDARSARGLEPWAASPHLQLALAYQSARNLPAAAAEIRRAINRDPSDWRLWVISAQIAQASGSPAAVRTSLAHARELNPRSPLFASGGTSGGAGAASGGASKAPAARAAASSNARASTSSASTHSATATAPSVKAAVARAGSAVVPGESASAASTPSSARPAIGAERASHQAAPTALSARVSHPIMTGFADDFTGPAGAIALQRARAAGASIVRIYVDWNTVAPNGSSKPAGFDAANPADPAYHWDAVDAQVSGAVSRGLAPILSFEQAPTWAEGSAAGLSTEDSRPGTVRPNAAEFGLFATAAARRYSGSFGGLPRVRYWQAWNEANHHLSLNPQFDVSSGQTPTPSGPIASVEIYRALLNAFAASVHAVHPDNLVIGGGLAPFFRSDPQGHASAPLTFMRQLLCIDASDRPIAGCNGKADFDVWSTHPYTSGDPTHKANSPYDVSLGNLPEVRRVLAAAQQSGHIVSNGPVAFWITEFSWDSKPPDPFGLPTKLENRWVAETLYRVWTDGVDLLTWFQVTDSLARNDFQAGLYYACPQGPQCDRPKPALKAFRFPFVAYKRGRHVVVWGRTPGGIPATVAVQQKSGSAWKTLKRLHSDRFGVFSATLKRKGGGDLRAVKGGRDASLPFSLKVPPDYPVNPFGHSPPNELAKS